MSSLDHARDRAAIEQAILRPDPHTVVFEYYDRKGQHSRREVEPYELTSDALLGYCRMRQNVRKFHLVNMGNVRLGEPFKPERVPTVDGVTSREQVAKVEAEARPAAGSGPA